MTKRSKVPVGATPKSMYATWDDHREAMRADATAMRTKRLALRRRPQ